MIIMIDHNDYEKQRKTHDLGYINDVSGWGCFPFCALKRSQYGMPDAGFLVANLDLTIRKNADGQIIMYLDLFLCHTIDHKPLKDMAQKTYPSVEAILADGWEVD